MLSHVHRRTSSSVWRGERTEDDAVGRAGPPDGAEDADLGGLRGVRAGQRRGLHEARACALDGGRRRHERLARAREHAQRLAGPAHERTCRVVTAVVGAGFKVLTQSSSVCSTPDTRNRNNALLIFDYHARSFNFTNKHFLST